MRVVLLSVTGREDKPLTYPTIFTFAVSSQTGVGMAEFLSFIESRRVESPMAASVDRTA